MRHVFGVFYNRIYAHKARMFRAFTLWWWRCAANEWGVNTQECKRCIQSIYMDMNTCTHTFTYTQVCTSVHLIARRKSLQQPSATAHYKTRARERTRKSVLNNKKVVTLHVFGRFPFMYQLHRHPQSHNDVDDVDDDSVTHSCFFFLTKCLCALENFLSRCCVRASGGA